MKIKELKRLLKGVPDDVEVCITDVGNFTSDFEVGAYHDETQTYLDLIMPVFIGRYTKDGNEEETILY